MPSDIFPVLHTERLDLIEITPGHAPDMFRLFTDKKVIEYYHVKPFKTEADLLDIIDMLAMRFKDGAGIRWAIVLKGSNTLIGNIGFNNFTKGHRSSIAYALLPEYWGSGYLTEAIKAVVTFGFNVLEVNRIEAEVMPGNRASERVLEKNGFTHEGLLRDWIQWMGKQYDVNMYSLINVMECDNVGEM